MTAKAIIYEWLEIRTKITILWAIWKHNKKNQTLQEMKRAQLQSFFNSTATLMTEQLQVSFQSKKIWASKAKKTSEINFWIWFSKYLNSEIDSFDKKLLQKNSAIKLMI